MIIRAGSSSASFGPVAQLGERTVRIRKVVGSNPFRSTKNHRDSVESRWFFYSRAARAHKKEKKTAAEPLSFCLGWKRFYHFNQWKFTGNQLLVLAQATLMTGSSV